MTESLYWSQLPGIPQTTLEYLQGQPDLVNLLGGDFHSPDLLKVVAEKRHKVPYPRDLASAIHADYGEENLTPEMKHSLELLKSGEALAVVTGQQLGLFGGPLYTYYKCLSVIALAQRLTHQLSQPVIPLFWLENADSDYSEIVSIALPQRDGDIFNLIYTTPQLYEGPIVAYHRYGEEIGETVASLRDYFRDRQSPQGIVDSIAQIYQPGKRVTDAFRELLRDWFGGEGLLAVDPRSPHLLPLTSPFWVKVWEKPNRLLTAISIASRILIDLHLPLQVPLRDDVLPVYYLTPDHTRFRLSLKGERVEITRGEEIGSVEMMRQWALDNPDYFSPSALLRPLLQDFLLPTLAYVAGPSELAYHSQSGKLYDILDIPHPVLIPRLSASLVEPFIKRLLSRHNWSFSDALGGKEVLLAQKGLTPENIVQLFDSGSAHLKAWLERIKRAVEESTPQVDISQELDRARRKLTYQWEKLRHLTLRKLNERDNVRIRHSEQVIAHLLPQGKLQERVYSPLYFMALYGQRELRNRLLSDWQPFDPKHLVIYL